MAKAKTQFVCQNCGTVHSRWAGKCDGCGEWNTIVEEDPMGGIGSGPGKAPPSLQFFDRAGATVHQMFMTGDSDLLAYRARYGSATQD